MSFLGNVIWFLCGGFLSFLGYVVGGLALCLTLVGIPFGVQSFKLGLASLAPFGKELHNKPRANGPLRTVFNILWILLFGWEIALHHLVWAAILGITVVGLPFAAQHLKLIPLALLPFGRELR